MSKFFEVALVDADNEGPSKCTLTARCQLPGHRCLSLGDFEIGGRSLAADVLSDFFCHMYSVADGTGKWKAVLMEKRCDSLTEPYYIQIAKKVDHDENELVVESHEYDAVYTIQTDLDSFLDLSGWDAVTVGTVWWLDHSYGSDRSLDTSQPHCFLANYFQCDPLMALYAKQAEITANKILSDTHQTAFPVAWGMLRLSDLYGWSAAREICVKVCSKDKECRNHVGWKEFARTLKFDILLEVFFTVMEKSN